MASSRTPSEPGALHRLLDAFADRMLGQGESLSPQSTAIKIAVIIFLLGFTYILLSSLFTGLISLSVEQLMYLEIAKGLMFIGLMSAGLYVLLATILRHICQQQELLKNQSAAILLSQKQASAGLLASSLGHDVNNVVQVLIGSVEQLQDSPALEDVEREILDGLRESAEHLSKMAGRLSANARERVPVDEGQQVLLREVATDIAAMLGRLPKLRRVTIEIQIPKDLCMQANRVALEQSLINLLLNSAEAAPQQCHVLFRCEIPENSGEDFSLEVHDDGPGVPEELREQILSGLYTTKSGGTGLGLLSVKACAALHGGRVEICDSELGGACFRLCFPAKMLKRDTVPVTVSA